MGFWGSKKKKRVAVIGLDGVPHGFVREMAAKGELPHLAKLFAEGDPLRMHSTVPCVSSVAWASYMTGKNPGKHNIFGFVDRDPETLEMTIPTAREMGCGTLWELLSGHGKRVLVINVPMTYPPRPVNGVLIGCFLCTNIDKVAYPKELSERLKREGYRIDVDAWQARKDRAAFLKDLHETLWKRVEVSLGLYREEPWDFFQLHVMETDRINHFFWHAWEDPDSPDREALLSFYREVDRAVGEIVSKIDPGSELVILSDHGFCPVKKEVQLNAWLREQGWLKLRSEGAKQLKDLDSSSLVYSLLPGRLYLTPAGKAAPDEVRAELDREISRRLQSLADPETGEPMIDRVLRREEAYRGAYREKGPDWVAVPMRGYDLKGSLSAPHLVHRGDLTGMHTDDDAFLYVRGHRLREGTASIMDVCPTILDLMDLEPDKETDGVSLVP
jgi:predicted AlkP superfamily phosphohydrolase/phosphomutase